MPGGKGIEVQPGGLTDFAGKVENQTNRGLQPEIDKAMASYRQGTKFGLGLSAACNDLETARQKYQQCLQQGSLTLTEYARASEILVAAINQVKKNYGNADAAAANNDAVIVKAMGDVSATIAKQRTDGQNAYNAAQIANQHGAGASTLQGDYQNG